MTITSIFADAYAYNLKELATKDDLAQSINLLRTDLKADIGLLRAEMNGQFKLVNWMLGALIPLVVAILVRLFFIPVR